MKKTLKILMLEDLKEDIWLVRRVLTKDGLNYQMEEVDSREEFIHALERFVPDVVLSDHSLPQFNSIEALKICKKKTFDTPFILVTGTVSEEFAVSCLKEGADDYVLKSNLNRLPSAIKHALKERNADKKRKAVELKLRQQNQELLKINNELDTFVYNISHNLRAPLLSALGLVRLSKLEIASKKYDSMDIYCNKIEESVLKLDETLREILDYSRNARSEINIEIIDFKQIIGECLNKMKYLSKSSEIEKQIVLNQKEPFANDKYRIRVIFNNLISNAIKYSDASKSKMTLNFNINISQQQADITIEDNGIGIDDNYMPKIFGMFYRATEKSDGSGLGLYIVKENVEKLKGLIKVHSRLRHGTTFQIMLPNQIRSLGDNPQ